ncbi:NAD(P)-binding domain-containing protein [Shigella boydii]
MSKQQIGVVGWSHGRNLALNIQSRGYSVLIFNRSQSTDEVIAEIHKISSQLYN